MSHWTPDTLAADTSRGTTAACTGNNAVARARAHVQKRRLDRWKGPVDLCCVDRPPPKLTMLSDGCKAAVWAGQGP